MRLRRGVKDEKVSITGTLIIQMIVFLILVGFTMKFVWPPIAAALDERASKIAEGLAAADKAKAELSAAKARGRGAGRVAQRDRTAPGRCRAPRAGDHRGGQGPCHDEGAKIVAAARAEAEQQTVKAREALREQVAALAVKGAEQILRKEVNAGVHAELLNRLKTEL
jgi:F-type H+-transporting ATPase subunit b